MASLSPPPNSSPSDAPPPQSSAPPPDPSPPSSPPPVTPSTPPPQPPVASPPPPTPIVDPPISSRPPPSQSSPPPASITPPAPPSKSPTNSTPPSSAPPPANTTPPALPIPPQKSPSPPPPQNTISPPPATTPPEPSISSPPPPISVPPPRGSTPPPATALPPSPSNASPSPGLTPTLPSQPTRSPPNTDTPPTVRPNQPPPQISSPSSDNKTGPSAPDRSNSKGGGIGPGVIVAIGIVVGIVMLILVWLAFWCFKKQRKGAPGSNGDYVMPSSLSSSQTADANFVKAQVTVPLMGTGSSTEAAISSNGSGGLGNSRSWFTYEELLKATNGFSTQNLLGEGGFGSVYKGCLPDGREVAVKQLKVGGGQGEREFKAEVEIISRIHHRHLVSLVGYCISDNQRLLVYDYVPNNTLHFHLHGEGRPVMDWAARVKIAAGAARGIAYLHEDCDPRIIHRDIKLSNILLDNNFEAKVSDFGLAKLALDTDTHVTTRVMGTFGYMAPEYASSGKLTEKSDVFSYGVVLLELITGRMAVDVSRPVGDESLVEWARPVLGPALANEDFDDLVDPRLEKNYIESEMFIMIEAAAACVRHSAGKRPRMGQLVRAFEGLTTSDLSNGMRVGESEAFNSSERATEIKLLRRMAFGSQNYCIDVSSQSSFDS